MMVLVSGPFQNPSNACIKSELIQNTGAKGEEYEESHRALRHSCRSGALTGKKNSGSLDVFVAEYFQRASSGLGQGKLRDRYFQVCTCSTFHRPQHCTPWLDTGSALPVQFNHTQLM